MDSGIEIFIKNKNLNFAAAANPRQKGLLVNGPVPVANRPFGSLRTQFFTILPQTHLVSEVRSAVGGRVTRDTLGNPAGTVAKLGCLEADHFSQAAVPTVPGDTSTARDRNCRGVHVWPHVAVSPQR